MSTRGCFRHDRHGSSRVASVVACPDGNRCPLFRDMLDPLKAGLAGAARSICPRPWLSCCDWRSDVRWLVFNRRAVICNRAVAVLLLLATEYLLPALKHGDSGAIKPRSETIISFARFTGCVFLQSVI